MGHAAAARIATLCVILAVGEGLRNDRPHRGEAAAAIRTAPQAAIDGGGRPRAGVTLKRGLYLGIGNDIARTNDHYQAVSLRGEPAKRKLSFGLAENTPEDCLSGNEF